MTQLNLILSTVTDKAERHTAQVYAALADGQWHTRRDLLVNHGLKNRTVRMVAQHSRGQILRGPKGFILANKATVEEIDECLRKMNAQIKAMGADVQDYLRVLSRRNGVAA